MRRIAVCIALLCAICICVSATVPPHLSQEFNPLGKKHAVSRSTFHTDQGIVRDTSRAYADQGTSHIRHAYKQNSYSTDQGVHLWDPYIYQNVTEAAMAAFNTTATLPTIEEAASGVPEQVKISITARPGEMVINWLTWNTTNSVVKYGTSSGNYPNSVTGSSITFVDPNSFHIIRYIHNVLLTNLGSMTTYYYVVGDPSIDQWSQELKFTTLSTGNDVVTIGIFGDMGVVNSQSMQLLSGEVAAGTINAVLHVGDYAYNMDEVEGLTGDIFLEEMSNITSAVPYMGTPGNHEQAFNFSHFANRFSNFNFIPDPAGKPDQNWWYSWDITSGGSNIHFISIDTELYYWAYASKAAQEHNLTEAQVRNFQQMIVEQYNWLVDDLTTSYDSGKYDWIFAYGHRPMYCSNIDDVPDCTDDAEVLRMGPKRDGNYGLETAFKLRPVDIYFSAHEHSYERTLPVKNGVIDFQKDPNMYIDPLYTTQIITGAGGCREFYDWYDQVFYGPWSILRSVSYGYGRLTIHNSTHLFWEQLLDEGRAGTDPLWIIKQAQRKVFTNETDASGLFPSEEDQHAAIESTSVDQEFTPTKPVEVAVELPVAVPATLIPTHQPQQIATE